MENQDINTIANILKTIPLFEQLNENDHQEIIKRITMQYYPVGHVIFNEGDQGDNMYIIKSGLVKVFHKGDVDGLDQSIATLGDNDYFGEMALISDNPRNATVKVIEDVQVFILNKDDLIKLISENPDIATKISHEYLQRFKKNMQSSEQ